MRVTLHMCMPAGDAMRRRFGELLEVQKIDNRAVIAAMLDNGQHVADTVGELGLRYVPETNRNDQYGQPIMDIYGVYDMVRRRTFSCGDAAAYEAAVFEEKYGVPTQCLSVAQGDTQMHAVFVVPGHGVVDPTANFHASRRTPIPKVQNPVAGQLCKIHGGRVVCDESDVCCVDEDGSWYCPAVPGVSGVRQQIGKIHRSPGGQLWSITPDGSAVPICKKKR